MGRSHAKSKSLRFARRHLAKTLGVANEDRHRDACLKRLHASVARTQPSESVARLQKLLGGGGAASVRDANPEMEMETVEETNAVKTSNNVPDDDSSSTAVVGKVTSSKKVRKPVANKGMGKSFGKQAGKKAAKNAKRGGQRKFKF